MPDFSKYDCTDRVPRIGQYKYLQHLKNNWDKAEIHAGILPTGAGKSLISRAIQVGSGADVITISNALVTQYSEDYPKVNFLKGKAHYACRSGVTCKDWVDMGFDACESCPYLKAKMAALEGQATFYNPMSYYYHLLNGGKGADTVVVDEAHQLPAMVLMLSGRRLKKSDYAFSDKCLNEIFFIRWARDQIRRLDTLASMYYGRNELVKLAKCKGEIESLSILCKGVEEDPQNYVFWIEKEGKETYLNVKPVFPPKFLMDRLLGGKKVVLMSGTLFDHDIRDIAGDRSVIKYEMPSPIPKANREIQYRPAPFAMNYNTDPKKLAEYVLQFLEPGKNTLIHTTYGWSKKLSSFMPPNTIVNTQEDKEEKIEEFKQKGGVFLASGCAEGLDFKGDLCRLNIISKLNIPNMKDPIVAKRLAMQDGSNWLTLEALRVAIQQAGRSTRSENDFSKTIICDPNFRRMMKQVESQVPEYFKEAINWRPNAK
jgi:Rad3-related DNA helicase